MTNTNLIVSIIILVVCVIIALVIGYLLGSRFGGKKSVAMREARQEHDSYKDDVREHFEQTSAIMSRIVDDYRDMYAHMSDGAEKLADMHPERQITPPPTPEAITRDSGDGRASNSPSAQTDTSSNRNRFASTTRAVMASDSSNDRPWNKESGAKQYGLD